MLLAQPWLRDLKYHSEVEKWLQYVDSLQSSSEQPSSSFMHPRLSQLLSQLDAIIIEVLLQPIQQQTSLASLASAAGWSSSSSLSETNFSASPSESITQVLFLFTFSKFVFTSVLLDIFCGNLCVLPCSDW
jgi:hypothetical protein